MTNHDDWHHQLTPDQFHVTRQKGTEPPFSGEYVHCERSGVYTCVCCGQALFRSESKYDSGSGWPSFFSPADKTRVRLDNDRSQGMVRTEVSCSSCGAHLGHLFEDGPAPTGLRYCINSVALKLDTTTDP